MFQKFVTKHCSQVFIINEISEDIFLIRHEIGKHLVGKSLPFRGLVPHDDETVLKNVVTCLVELAMRPTQNECLFEI
jgi:hypothetical protein